MPTPWTELRALVDPIARRLGYYTAYPLDAGEYLGTSNLPDAISYLRDNNYRPQRLSAAKRHPETNQLHDASFRRVPTTHPEDAIGTKIVELFDPNECQYHVHAFEREAGFDFYSHYEARPDFFKPNLSLPRLRTHYRPAWGETYLLGVTDLELNP